MQLNFTATDLLVNKNFNRPTNGRRVTTSARHAKLNGLNKMKDKPPMTKTNQYQFLDKAYELKLINSKQWQYLKALVRFSNGAYLTEVGQKKLASYLQVSESTIRRYQRISSSNNYIINHGGNGWQSTNLLEISIFSNELINKAVKMTAYILNTKIKDLNNNKVREKMSILNDYYFEYENMKKQNAKPKPKPNTPQNQTSSPQTGFKSNFDGAMAKTKEWYERHTREEIRKVDSYAKDAEAYMAPPNLVKELKRKLMR